MLDASSFTSLADGLPKYNVNLGTVWTLARLTVSLKEVIYDTTSALASDDGATTPGVITYYEEKSGVIPITDIDIGYDVLQSLKLTIGAVNVLNRYPDKINPALIAAYQKAGFPFAAEEYTSSPIGTNGGYYYLKATYTF